MKILNSFSATIFNRHRIQYECGAYAETEFSNVFFFLLATTDRAEDTNQYNQYINQQSVNLSAIDIDISDFGDIFNPVKLDFNNSEMEELRNSVLHVLRKVSDLSN